MLGKIVRVRITNPIGSTDTETGYTYPLNFGVAEKDKALRNYGIYVMGVDHPARIFDGRIVARLRFDDEVYFIAAPKSSRYINCEILKALNLENRTDCELECLYERSCGAVVYSKINGEIRYLLIKNKHSANWGFPKGHMEMNEKPTDTARREVLEETGLHIDFVSDLQFFSEYKLQNKIEKSVIIFLASANDTKTTIQQEEIEDYVWLGYEKAYDRLKFDNDKKIMKDADDYLKGVLNVCTV